MSNLLSGLSGFRDASPGLLPNARATGTAATGPYASYSGALALNSAGVAFASGGDNGSFFEAVGILYYVYQKIPSAAGTINVLRVTLNEPDDFCQLLGRLRMTFDWSVILGANWKPMTAYATEGALRGSVSVSIDNEGTAVGNFLSFSSASVMSFIGGERPLSITSFAMVSSETTFTWQSN